MNISDKEQFYREIYRVLSEGGKLVFHEIMAGRNEPVHYPVFWAKDASINFLRQPAEIRGLLGKIGFEEVIWQDATPNATRFAKARLAAGQGQSAGTDQAGLGLQLVLGDNFYQAAQTAVLNLAEERVAIIEGVFTKAGANG